MAATTSAVPVGLKVIDAPGKPTHVARIVLAPTVNPRVQLPTVATCALFVGTELPVIVPPPPVTVNATGTPGNTTLLGIYRRLHLRSVGKEKIENEDYEEEYDDPDSAPIDELMHEEIEMQAGRLPRHEGIIMRTTRRIARAFGHSPK